jgi:3-phosphoshikimate 1-carboxyvinyltransferase
MTVDMLRRRGVHVTDEDDQWLVAPGPVAARDEAIEPDLSNAAPFLAAAAVTGGTVTVRNWPGRTQQAGDHFPEILRRFGADVRRGSDELTVSGSGELHGIDVDLHDHGELTPAVAAVAALARATTRIRGVAHLRGHESDRLAALARELSKLGAAVAETEDGLEISSRAVRSGATFRTYADHRMAHAAAVIGLLASPLYVDDVATTSKTFPGFADAWSGLVLGPA